MAMSVGSRMFSFFVSSWIIIHLGRKPVSGGRPPRDSMIVRTDAAIIGDLFHEWDSVSVVVEELNANSRNVAVVIRT